MTHVVSATTPDDWAFSPPTRERGNGFDPAVPALIGAEPAHEEIAHEAYARYVAQGYEHGHEVEDWVEAQRALRQRR